MSTPIKHLTLDAVLAIHAEVLAAHGGIPGLRSRELLESAVAAPQATMFGKALIADPIEIASAYLFYLCSNHAFLDGNKRVALAACLVFLSENGLLHEEALNADDWERLTLDVAHGALTRDEVPNRLRELVS